MTLEDELRTYTNLSHANAWRRASPEKPDEPAYVSSLISFELFRGLRKTLRKYATPGTKVLTRGIFTHQTPKVALLTQTSSVEIGDLMFVHQHFTSDPRNPVSGRALLLQAKRTLSPKTGSLASGTQSIQFELYRDWSPFKGTSRLPEAPPGAPHWDFKLGGPLGRQPATAGSAYVTIFKENAYTTPSFTPQWAAPLENGPSKHKLIAKKYPAECTWSVGNSPAPDSAPKLGVSCLTDFGSALSNFLIGSIGRDFTPGTLTGSDHWSIFINMMLAESGRPSGDYIYKSSNQGIPSAARGRHLSFVALETAFRHSLVDETDDFLESIANSTNFDGFELTNQFLRRLEDYRRYKGEAPPSPPPDFAPSWQGGHVPMLLVTTIGVDDQPFTSQRG